MDNIQFLTPETTTVTTATDADGNVITAAETQTTVDTSQTDVSDDTANE